jgi:hypothetical protein
MEDVKRLIRERTKDCVRVKCTKLYDTNLFTIGVGAVGQYNDKATEFTTEVRTYIPGRDKRFPLPERPDRLRVPPILLFSGY